MVDLLAVRGVFHGSPKTACHVILAAPKHGEIGWHLAPLRHDLILTNDNPAVTRAAPVTPSRKLRRYTLQWSCPTVPQGVFNLYVEVCLSATPQIRGLCSLSALLTVSREGGGATWSSQKAPLLDLDAAKSNEEWGCGVTLSKPPPLLAVRSEQGSPNLVKSGDLSGSRSSFPAKGFVSIWLASYPRAIPPKAGFGDGQVKTTLYRDLALESDLQFICTKSQAGC